MEFGEHWIRLPLSRPDIVKLDTLSMTIEPVLPFTLNSPPFSMMCRFELMLSRSCQKLSGDTQHVSPWHRDGTVVASQQTVSCRIRSVAVASTTTLVVTISATMKSTKVQTLGAIIVVCDTIPNAPLFRLESTKVQTLGAISESIYEQDREQDTAPHWPKRCYLSAEPISRGLVASAGKLDWTSASPPVRWAASGKGLHGPLGKVYLLWNKLTLGFVCLFLPKLVYTLSICSTKDIPCLAGHVDLCH